MKQTITKSRGAKSAIRGAAKPKKSAAAVVKISETKRPGKAPANSPNLQPAKKGSKNVEIQQNVYNEESIRSLDWREHIRLRPGMYIGKLGDGASADDG